jgi:hypothetical protein
MCRCEKNVVLPLRYVSKAFNTTLRPYVLKTVQLEFSRFSKDGPKLPNFEALEAVGGFCHAVYLDMMVVRDEGTLECLFGVHVAIPASRDGLASCCDCRMSWLGERGWTMAEVV